MARYFSNKAFSFVFFQLFLAKQRWGIAGQPASHRAKIALHCPTPGCTVGGVLGHLRGLVWVIKFDSINAMGVPLSEVTPST